MNGLASQILAIVRIVVVTANQIALALELYAIRHDLSNTRQLASAVLAVERRVITIDPSRG
jgi:hypothetical protein